MLKYTADILKTEWNQNDSIIFGDLVFCWLRHNNSNLLIEMLDWCASS